MIDSYSRPIVDTLISLMREQFGTVFTAYYDGDPIYIPAQHLPCLIIDKQSTSLPGQAPTGTIRLEHTITVQAEFDKRPEFNKKPDLVYLKKKLEQIAEGIDASTGEIGQQTIAGILQRNLRLKGYSIGQSLDINYGLFPRGQDVLTQGVTVTATIIEQRVITRAA